MSNLDDLKKQVENITGQNAALQKQIENLGQQSKAMQAQCKAFKQLVDALTNDNVILRTNLLLQQEHSAAREQVIQQLQAAQAPDQRPALAQVKDSKTA